MLFFILGTISIKSPGQTWEIFDRNYNLIQKVENGNFHILGSTLRINDSGENLNLLGNDYEAYSSISGASIYQYLEPWLIVRKDSLFGAFHEYGDQPLLCEYDRIQTYYNLLLAQKGNEFFLYDRGKKNIESIGKFESARFAKNGQVIAKNPRGYYLPISKDPNHLYELLEDTCGDVILAREGSGFGLINREGEYILEPIIDEMKYTKDNHFFAQNGDEFLLIKAQTNEANIRYNSFHRIAIEDDVMVEYIHGKLRRIMKEDGILLDIVGMTGVQRTGKNHFNVFFRDDKTGLLNEKGKWEVRPTVTAEKLYPGNDGFYGALMGDQYGFVNREGLEIIPAQFDEIKSFSEGLSGVKKGLTWGYINQNAELVIPYFFDEVGDFYQGLAIVKKNNQYNLVNRQGENLLENYYDRISMVSDNYYLTEENGLFGLLNPSGMEILSPEFNELRREGLDHILIRKGDKYGVIKENGDFSLPLFYSEILFDSGNQKVLAKYERVEPIPEEVEAMERKKKKRKQKGA
ncbi:MAG: WG repeat-containing protein [Cyclobacteriaceae bacterium]